MDQHDRVGVGGAVGVHVASFRADADYDEMVRGLGYVWDCPHDGTANVTGYRCAGCGQTRATASMAAAAHTGDARDIPTTISAG